MAEALARKFWGDTSTDERYHNAHGHREAATVGKGDLEETLQAGFMTTRGPKTTSFGV